MWRYAASTDRRDETRQERSESKKEMNDHGNSAMAGISDKAGAGARSEPPPSLPPSCVDMYAM